MTVKIEYDVKKTLVKALSWALGIFVAGLTASTANGSVDGKEVAVSGGTAVLLGALKALSNYLKNR